MYKKGFLGMICILFAVNTYADWFCATENAGWSARFGHTSVVFQDKMWVIGGMAGSYRQNDVWCSSDGISWTKVSTDSILWEARHGHTSVVFNNKIWVIGGYYYDGSVHCCNDVWYSSNGINWTKAVENAPWQGRIGHTSVVFDNKIWVIGGRYSDGIVHDFKNDVWYSNDGINWTEAIAQAPWEGRSEHTSIVFDNKIWVIGGYCYDGATHYRSNDVWYSNDGINWTEAGDARWSGRSNHKSVVFNNKMWVMGGFPFSNEVWCSNDGMTWDERGDAPWEIRHSHSSIVFDNKIWIIGGHYWRPPEGHGDKNDVWYYLTTGIEEKSQISNLKSQILEIFPNPFSSKTVIKSTVHRPQTTDKDPCLPAGTGGLSTMDYGLKIYDLSGRLVRSFPITDNQKPITEVSWDGRDNQGKEVMSGIYFIKFVGATSRLRPITKKVVVIR